MTLNPPHTPSDLRVCPSPCPLTLFHKDMGMRIDHVYADAALAGQVQDAYIDREARKGEGPSDHAPVVVDINLYAQASVE